MIKCLESPNKSFETKKEMFKWLQSNQDNLIALKKAAIKRSEGVSLELPNKDSNALKGIDGLKEGFVYPIINTTNFMDSHNDVHLPKIWNKSVKEQQGKVFYVTDHDLKVASVIAFPKDVKMSVQKLDWSDISKGEGGSTEALMFEVPIGRLRTNTR